MTRDVTFGLIFVAASTIIFTVFLLAGYISMEYQVNLRISYLLPIATLAPLFYSSLIASGLIRAKSEKLSRKEHIVFALIAIGGTAAASFVTEAEFLYRALSQVDDITFSEVLFAPLNKRYTVTVLFGASLAVSATAVAAFVAAIRVPATIAVRIHRAAKADIPTDPTN